MADSMDIAMSAIIDQLITGYQERQKNGEVLNNDQLIVVLAQIFNIPDDPEESAGPVLVFAAELLLRAIRKEFDHV